MSSDFDSAVWDSTNYAKWYQSHRRFSFTAHFCIEHYEEGKQIPTKVFSKFVKSLHCHSKSEEKMFAHMNLPSNLFDEHSKIIPQKEYSNFEMYILCKELLIHMKEEEKSVMKILKSIE